MTSWVLVPCLITLRDEFNQLNPKRDKASDGAVGDLTHQAEGNSDHDPDEQFPALKAKDADNINEVHAIDVDNDGPWPAGLTFDKLIQIIVERCRSGAETRLQYVIWNRRIWSRSWGWTARAYTGASPHTEHGHFSAVYTTAQENDTRPWGLTAALNALTEDSMAGITIEQIQASVTDGVLAVLADGYHAAMNDATYKAATPERQRAMRNVRDFLQGIVGGPTEDDIAAAQAALTAAINGAGTTDAARIVQGVLAGLPAGQAKQIADELAARLAA